MNCPVCSCTVSIGADWSSATYERKACSTECASLLFEADLEATPYERLELTWRWRRRLATAQGSTFDEPAPPSPAEQELRRIDLLSSVERTHDEGRAA